MKKVKLIAVFLLCVMLALTLTACVDHIEDVNGDDDFSLAVIKDDDIINGYNLFVSSSSHFTVGNTTTIKIGKLSGVDTLETITVSAGDHTISTEMTTTAGNVRLVLVKNDQIVYDFNINGSDSYALEFGVYYLKIAGESAVVSRLRYAIV